MTDSQQLVFAGGYAAAAEPGIRAYRFDSAARSLTPCGTAAGIINPSFLLPHPNGRWLFAVSETHGGADGPGSVWALRWEQAAGADVAFTPVNAQPSGGLDPCHLVLDQTGRWLIVSNYSSGTAGVLPIADDGALGAMTDHVQHAGTGASPQRQEGPHAHSAIVSADNRWVIVADLGIDQLVVYGFDAVAGTLTPGGHGAARPGAGPRHMAFSPDQRLLYVANELDNTVSVYTFDAASGALDEVQTLPTVPDGSGHSQVADIHLTPDARRLLVSNRGHNSLAVFAVGSDGRLSAEAVVGCGGDWPRNFAIAPDGDAVLVANQNSGTLDALPLAGDAGLGAATTAVELPAASCVVFVAPAA